MRSWLWCGCGCCFSGCWCGCWCRCWCWCWLDFVEVSSSVRSAKSVNVRFYPDSSQYWTFSSLDLDQDAAFRLGGHERNCVINEPLLFGVHPRGALTDDATRCRGGIERAHAVRQVQSAEIKCLCAEGKLRISGKILREVSVKRIPTVRAVKLVPIWIAVEIAAYKHEALLPVGNCRRNSLLPVWY